MRRQAMTSNDKPNDKRRQATTTNEPEMLVAGQPASSDHVPGPSALVIPSFFDSGWDCVDLRDGQDPQQPTSDNYQAARPQGQSPLLVAAWEMGDHLSLLSSDGISNMPRRLVWRMISPSDAIVCLLDLDRHPCLLAGSFWGLPAL
jgi:hypothetical protein